MTDALGQSQVLPYIQGLSAKGYRFTLISFEKKERFLKEKDLIQTICDASNIDWKPLFYTKRPPILSTVFDVFRLKKIARKVCEEKKISLVHCRSYISAIVGLFLKKKLKVKFLFDMRGFWADERVDGGIWNLKNPLYKLIYSYFKKKELQFFQQCDYCVSLTEVGKKELLSWNIKRENELKIKVIPCCVDTSFFSTQYLKEERRNYWLNQFKISSDAFTMCYLGSLSTVYLFDEVLNVVKRLKLKNEELKFLIFTHEPKEIVNNYLQRHDLLNADFISITSLTRKEVPEVLAVCDYSIYFCEPSKSRKGTSPTRLAELASCGVKVISNANVGDTKEIILNNNLGEVLNDFKDIEIEKLIHNFTFEKTYDKNQLRKVAIDLFDVNIGIERYNNVYESLVES